MADARKQAPVMLLVPLLLIPLIHGARAECKDAYKTTPGGLIHTACKPPINDPKCKKISSGIQPEEQKEILDTHNKFRSQVSTGNLPGFPAATNMYQMLWDNELADVAQAHADQCKFEHDSSEQRFTTKFMHVGQNLAFFTSSDSSAGNRWSEIVEEWVAEYNSMQPSLIQRYKPGGYGHFTQVVWAKTQYVGCGFLKYGTVRDITRLYVCNYAPAGNYLTMPVYDSTGPMCSKCPAGTVCSTATGLCESPTKGVKVTGRPKSSLAVRFSPDFLCFILTAVAFCYNV